MYARFTDAQGAFHLTKRNRKFRNWYKLNGTEIALKNFQKIRKLLNLQKVDHANIFQWKLPSIGTVIFYRMESAPANQILLRVEKVTTLRM